MDVAAILSVLKTAVPAADCEAVATADLRPTVVVPGERLLEIAHAVRSLGFHALTDIVGVDSWPAEPRFELNYHLVDTDVPAQLRLRVRVPGERAQVPSVHVVWPSADWLEREVWDLFGVVFEAHGDLRRLLMPEDWEGHPLRKDYPVQIKMTPKVHEPLQLSEREFQANIEADRDVRGGTGRAGR